MKCHKFRHFFCKLHYKSPMRCLEDKFFKSFLLKPLNINPPNLNFELFINFSSMDLTLTYKKIWL